MDKIKEFERTARLLEPGAADRGQLLQHVIDYADAYLEAIATAPACNAHNFDGSSLNDSSITEEGMDIESVLTLLKENVDTTGFNPTSGRFLAYIPGGGLFHAALGDYLAAITNRYAGAFFASPGAVRMENMLLRWMATLVGYPETAAGNLTSGGSLANLTVVVTAREACEITGDVINRSVVYLTEHVHHSVQKALHVAGLRHCVQRIVPVDSNYRMDAGALESTIRDDKAAALNPWLVVASAGTTNTGSVDPLADIGAIAHAHGLWYHVDGAYGAFFVLCPEGAAILRGMDTSDSVVLDPHKTLFLPYGTGAVLVKDWQKLYTAHNWEAAYLQDFPDKIEELSPYDLSLELTKHFRGLRLWLPLKVLGVAPFRAALSEKIHLARYFYEEIQKIDGFEVGPYPDLSVVTYRYLPERGDPDEFNQRLTQALLRDGHIGISSTRIDNKVVLRLAVVSFRTHLVDIESALATLKRVAEGLVTASSVT